MPEFARGILIPNVGLSFVPAQKGEVLRLGPITCRIMEDGSHTGEPCTLFACHFLMFAYR